MTDSAEADIIAGILRVSRTRRRAVIWSGPREQLQLVLRFAHSYIRNRARRRGRLFVALSADEGGDSGRDSIWAWPLGDTRPELKR